jgi:hypothetical protein
LIELGAYLASSSYIVSLSGPPLADLKYGITVVPVGEESLLFNGYGDDAAMSPEFKEQIYAKSKVAQKENVKELQQKKLHEWINGVPSEPRLMTTASSTVKGGEGGKASRATTRGRSEWRLRRMTTKSPLGRAISTRKHARSKQVCPCHRLGKKTLGILVIAGTPCLCLSSTARRCEPRKICPSQRMERSKSLRIEGNSPHLLSQQATR